MKAFGLGVLSVFILLSCGRTNESTNTNNSMERTNDSTKIMIDTFSITSIFPSYKEYPSFVELKSCQIGIDVKGYVIYSVYVLNKSSVLSELSKQEYLYAVDQKKQPDKYKVISKENAETVLKGDTNNSAIAYYFKFKNLKNYEAYECYMNKHFHLIVFDTNSDTVYHRIKPLVF